MYSVGTIVKVIVDTPDGSEEKTKGDIGVITEINKYGDFTVATQFSDYLYGKEQLTEPTPEEIKDTLRKMIMKWR